MPHQMSLEKRIRSAIEATDLDAFAELLADDVRWGDGDHPRACRSRADVLRTFGALMSSGVRADIAELRTGANGVLCALNIHWPEGSPRADDTLLYHVYLVRDGLIYEVKRFDDRYSAAQAVGTDRF
ncbi:MAG: nuclear transport factor 2 family protein [Acidimicrobiales bacterium]